MLPADVVPGGQTLGISTTLVNLGMQLQCGLPTDGLGWWPNTRDIYYSGKLGVASLVAKHWGYLLQW